MTEKKAADIGRRLDYEASAGELSKWLATVRTSEWTPTESANRHRDLAKKVEAVVDLLDRQCWLFLEDEVDGDPPPETGLDGLPIVTSETNAGRYQGTILRLREIADTATRIANEYPNPRAKPELVQAAKYFLHIWLESEKNRPILYDKGGAVTDFKAVLDAARYVVTPSRVRGILAEALKDFNPHYHPPGFDLSRFLVWRK